MTHNPTVADLSGRPPGKGWLRRFRLPVAAGAALVAAGTVFAVIPNASAALPFAIESLDGSGNNVEQPDLGSVQPAVLPGRHGSLRRRHRRAGQRAQCPVGVQPDHR